MRMVTHLKRPGSELTACGQKGPWMYKTFDTKDVTCSQCMSRGKIRMTAPAPAKRTAGRVVQPGGGHRR